MVMVLLMMMMIDDDDGDGDGDDDDDDDDDMMMMMMMMMMNHRIVKCIFLTRPHTVIVSSVGENIKNGPGNKICGLPQLI